MTKIVEGQVIERGYYWVQRASVRQPEIAFYNDNINEWQFVNCEFICRTHPKIIKGPLTPWSKASG